MFSTTPSMPAVDKFLQAYHGENYYTQNTPETTTPTTTAATGAIMATVPTTIDHGGYFQNCESILLSSGFNNGPSNYVMHGAMQMHEFDFVNELLCFGDENESINSEANHVETNKNNEIMSKVYEVEGSIIRSKEKKSRDIRIIKGQWTEEEDRLLTTLVKTHGDKKWAAIAQLMNGRAGKQCRERWFNHLKPNIKKNAWSEDEERILVEIHKKIGNKWANIAKKIPGRTENSIKNHWNATKRRQNKRKKNHNKLQSEVENNSTILEEYIKSLHTLSTNSEADTNSWTSHSSESTFISCDEAIYTTNNINNNLVWSHRNELLGDDAYVNFEKLRSDEWMINDYQHFDQQLNKMVEESFNYDNQENDMDLYEMFAWHTSQMMNDGTLSG